MDRTSEPVPLRRVSAIPCTQAVEHVIHRTDLMATKAFRKKTCSMNILSVSIEFIMLKQIVTG